MDYTLADLIGRSVARIYNSSNTIPDIEDVYPTVFDKEELERKRTERRNQLLAIKFKQFAENLNLKFKEDKEF
jgi:hypothetical protein